MVVPESILQDAVIKCVYTLPGLQCGNLCTLTKRLRKAICSFHAALSVVLSPGTVLEKSIDIMVEGIVKSVQ